MDQKEIDYEIAQLKAIWGIEDMEIGPECEKIARKYLAGEISEDNLVNAYFVAFEADEAAKKKK